jgi:hypothetical protein
MPDAKDHDQYSAHPNLALAAIAASIARTLAESDATFLQRLKKNSEDVYMRLRDSGSDCMGALEALKNFRDLLQD